MLIIHFLGPTAFQLQLQYIPINLNRIGLNTETATTATD